jgi:deoxyribose-phosphate aldolase
VNKVEKEYGMKAKELRDEAIVILKTFDPDRAREYPVDTEKMAQYVDHTRLKIETTRSEIEAFCTEAMELSYKAVCFNPVYVEYAKNLLMGSSVKLATVVGFPLGASTPLSKRVEARDAVAGGADELDMVINVGALKDGLFALVLDDIAGVVCAAGDRALVKVIIETSALTDQEKVAACLLSKRAGAAFVKTSTGFGSGGATVNDVALMKQVVGEDVQVKASTGIKTRETAIALIKAGATRLGTSSGKAIVSQDERW